DGTTDATYGGGLTILLSIRRRDRQKTGVIAQPGDEPRRGLGLRGELAESLRDRNQGRCQVSAVDAGDIPGMQRGERCCVVPIEKVPAKALQSLERCQRVVETLEQSGRREIAKIVGCERREQAHPDVGG